MVDETLLNRISNGLAAQFETDDDCSVGSVEAYLKQQMAGMALPARIAALQAVVDRLDDTCRPCLSDKTDEEVLTRVGSLLLGRKVSMDGLSSSELLEKLAESLNTIFNTLNQLISVINMTFTGDGSPDQTIRQVIGFRFEGDGQGRSLETYLDQISRAFLTAQQSFKAAAHAKVRQVLVALDPEQVASEMGKGLKFGPMKKAEMFELYEERYQKVQKWFSSGRFMEDFLREFEKNCQSKFEK
jgi:hypothetical protein